jgi:FAD dependent oxidoreductase
MKIAIIGGGWVGCHLAYKLKNKHQITLFDKNSELFKETSYNNQNRLHYGFHYARNFKTRLLCKNTFSKFKKDYPELIKSVDTNLYCVPYTKSIVDYGTYKEIFKDYPKEISDIKFYDVEGCFNTNEMYIDFKKAHNFFNTELKDIFISKKISPSKINDLSKKYDLVINATNNEIRDHKNKNSFYELTVSFLYKKIKMTNFDALTMVDGEFFSIYPYHQDIFTVTDVTYTPIKKFKSIKNLNKFKESLDIDFFNKRRNLIEKKIQHYFPDFSSYFQYNGYFTSVKSKIISTSDDRYPVITRHDNIINCFTGKIQGIYIIEEKMNEIINELKDETRSIKLFI